MKFNKKGSIMIMLIHFRNLAALALALFLIQPAKAGWQLVWSDEFSGSSINANNWTFDIGTGPPYPGWGNNELEYYTSRSQNAYVSNGVLHIVAKHESYNGSSYTSAKMKSLGLFSQTYGRFEFRAKLPQGQLLAGPLDDALGFGLWRWAASGEIDVMENDGSNPASVLGTIHYVEGQWPNQDQSLRTGLFLPGGRFGDQLPCLCAGMDHQRDWLVCG